MTIGIVGRKSGMTRVFTDDGVSIPVSVIEVEPNRITQVKSVDTDGYSAVQVTIGTRRASRVTKSEAGHFANETIADTRADTGREAMLLVVGRQVVRVGRQTRQRTSPIRLWWDILPISAGVFGVPVGFAVTILVSLVTPPPSAKAQELVEYVRYPHRHNG